MNEKEKLTYNLNVKDLNAIEANAEDERPLKRHWANFSFYLMASLSIVLPLLFICKFLLTFWNYGQV
jgi:hypothetical protein